MKTGNAPRPRLSDVDVISLRDSEKFVEIWDGSKNYYGGDQTWYDTKVAEDGACGTVAAANITAYMTRFHKGYSNLYTYSNFSKSNFQLRMDEMYDYLSPYYIPVADVPLGIWPMGKFEKGVEKYAKARSEI